MYAALMYLNECCTLTSTVPNILRLWQFLFTFLLVTLFFNVISCVSRESI